MNNNIKVSVILPIYNVEWYLHESMDSIINQTLKEIEIICVNDGSTDNSLSILNHYSKIDTRIIVMEQVNQGAGVARNTGLEIAKGEYLSFLDPDDFFELTMLEELYIKATTTDADVVVCSFKTYDEKKKKFGGNYGKLNKNKYPPKETFSYKDMPNDFYLSFTHPSWNKFYKSKFIKVHNIKFQQLYRSNDTYFSFISLALAKKIAIIENILVYYRLNISNSSISTRHLYPLDFYTAWLETMRRLKVENLFNDLNYSFKQNLVMSIYSNLHSQKTYIGFRSVYQYVKSNSMIDFNIILEENIKYFNSSDYFIECYEYYKVILKYDFDEYMNLKEKYFIDENDASIKISLIIPVYNVEKYLRECLDSVVSQTFKNIEIICINDGSTDKSIEILREYAKNDERFVVLNQMNQGQSVARNKGISISKGKYIYFLDSDDMIVSYALERMYTECETNNLDIIYFDGKSFFENSELENKNTYYKTAYTSKFNINKVLSGAQLLTKMKENNSYNVSSCLYLIKSVFLKRERILFPEGIVYEDNVFKFKTILVAERVKHIKEELFLRRVRYDSTMTQIRNYEHFYGYLVCYLEMLNYADLFEYTEEVEKSVIGVLSSVFRCMINDYNVLSQQDKDKIKTINNIEINKFILCEYERIHPCLDNNIKELKSIGLGHLVPIPIVFICSDSEPEHLVISVISLIDNANQLTSYLIYILHNTNYSKEYIDSLNTLQEKYDNLKIVYIKIKNEYSDDIVEIANIVTSNLSQLERCICLKPNIIIQKDLRELFEVDLQQFNIGAVKELGNNNDFNSSVLLLNIGKIIEQKNNYEITRIDLKYNLSADHLSEEKTFNFGSKIKLNPSLKTIYENKVIKSALTDNLIFSYKNNITPINNSKCSFYYEWWKYFKMSPLNKIPKKSGNNPKVSVIIPIYNVEKYLSECLDSVINQTLEEIEIIGVDDGSTDNSLEVLHDYAKFDERIKILEQENQGAGVARNKGLDIAKGEYLSFLDPDDFFELTMLEQAYNKAIENDVDIVVYDYYMYNDNTKVISAVELGSPCENDVFSYKDITDNIFIRLHHNAWTKLYKTQFVRENNIRFQNLYRINDIFFTHTASIIAEKIAYLEKKLVYYRLGTKENSQSTLHMYHLSFYEAELAIKDRLHDLGYYKDVEEWFLNSLLDTMLFNLNKVINSNVGEEMYNYIRENLDKDFGITQYDKTNYITQLYDVFMLIIDNSFEDYILLKNKEKI